MSAPKKPWVAFVLSLVVPGAGLCYADKWVWGTINFAVVQLILLAAATAPAGSVIHEYFHYVLLIVAAGSAGVAHAVASQRANPVSPPG